MVKFDFIVLGATGMQGKIVSRDLLENGYSVRLCGRDKSRVEHILRKHPKKTDFRHIDIKDKKGMLDTIESSGASVAINCIEGDWNDEVLKVCIDAGIHSIDLGSDIPVTKKQFAMDGLLKKKNLTHITGCGSVPGIGNVMLRYIYDDFDKVEYAEAGFAWDSNLKVFVVPFSIASITEEFEHPADMILNHRHVTIKPLNTIVRCIHKGVEKEPCFNVGHHPETFTFYKLFQDKGIKDVKFFAGFPDHSFNVIKNFVDLGLSSTNPIDYRGTKIRPIDFLTEEMKRIKIPKGYVEHENLWVYVDGKREGKEKAVRMECIVHTLKGWEDAGSNIDTGMPASIMAQMIKKGTIKERGAFSPEFIIPPIPFFKELKKRKMLVYRNNKLIN